jgi:hypothetical protein
MLAPRQYWGVLAVGLLSGLVGGVLSDRLLSTDTVWAQLRQKVVYSEEFLLVDKNGKPRGGLGLGADGAVGLTLAGRDGIKILYVSPDDPHVLRLADKSGKTLWELP